MLKIMYPLFLNKEIVKKRWGREIILDSNSLYCMKILEYDQKGNFSSLHAHNGFYDEKGDFILGKVESWYVLSGEFELTFFSEEGVKLKKTITTGEVVRLNRTVFHGLKLLSDFGQIMEASTKDDKRDIVRVEPGMDQL